MKLPRKNRSKLPIIAWTAITVLLLGVGGYYAFSMLQKPSNDAPASSSIDAEPATNDQSSAGSDIKKQALEQDTASSDSTDTTDVTVEILPPTKNTDTVRIQATIQAVSNTGTCTLTLTKDDSVKTYSAGVQALSSYSTCKGFTVPLSDLSSGTWAITIRYSDGSASGTAASEVSI